MNHIEEAQHAVALLKELEASKSGSDFAKLVRETVRKLSLTHGGEVQIEPNRETGFTIVYEANENSRQIVTEIRQVFLDEFGAEVLYGYFS